MQLLQVDPKLALMIVGGLQILRGEVDLLRSVRIGR